MSDAPTRERILEAARDLFWRRGYDATSPRAIMTESGAGQGSLYHFFDGKKDLGAAAIEESADALMVALGRVFDERKPGLERIREWLEAPREALAGCRMGRLAMENSILEQEELRAPIARYFKAVGREIERALRDAQERSSISREIDPSALAMTLLAIVQGGYVLARATQDPGRLRAAVRGALELLEASRPNPRGRRASRSHV